MLDVNKLVVLKSAPDADSEQQTAEVRVETERLHQQPERSKSADQAAPQMIIRTRITDTELQKLVDDGWRIHFSQFVPVGDTIEFCAVFTRAAELNAAQSVEPVGTAEPVEPVGTVQSAEPVEPAKVRTVRPTMVVGASPDESSKIRETARRHAPFMFASGETYDDLLKASEDTTIEPRIFTRRVLSADLPAEDRRALLNQHLLNWVEAHTKARRKTEGVRQFRTIEEIVKERRERRKNSEQALTPGTD